MSEDKLKMYERALAREKAARKEAERILEDKSRELFYKSQELQKANIQLERLVQEKTSELKGVFENIVDAYVVTNLLGDVLKMNEAAEALLDFTIEDKKNLMDTLHPDDYEKAAIGFQKLYKTGSLTGFNIRIVAHGNTILLELNASIVYDENKQPIAAQGIVRDITQQKAAEQKLINSENRLSAVISNLESGILLEDENRKVVIANERFCDFFSIAITPAELIGQDCTNAAERYKHLFENEERFVTRIKTLIKLKEQVVGDELQLKDGRIIERDFIPIYEEGKYKGHLTTYRDVTLHRRFRKNIEAERAKYSSIIANMELGLVEVDTNDKILMVNQSLEEMSGYKEQELLGKRGRDILLDKESQQRLLEENKKRLKGTSNSYEVVAITKQGEKRHWLISGAPNYDVSGNIIGSIGIHLDITAIKELELQKESLLQKLASSNHELQEYAHVVSHDLKSPLRSLDALLTWVKEDNVDGLSSDSLENLDLMGTTLEKMEQLISDVLEYSSVSSDEKEVQDVSVSGVIDDIEKLLHIPDNIRIEREDTLPIIKADRVRIQQLFQNLMSNAIRYSDKEMGIIKIGCEQGKEYNTFSVSDNGIGIEKEYHDKIFEIFQSLNKHKDSTGIGLSIVKKIVDLYSGKIWLESTPGEGTTFFFTLKNNNMKTVQLQRQKDKEWQYLSENVSLKSPLVLVFGNRYLLEDAVIYEEVRSLFPDGHLIFGSSSGEIVAGAVNDEHITITAIEFEKTRFEVQTTSIIEAHNDSEQAGRTVVEKLSKEGLKHIFVISEGSSVNGSALTKGMQEAAPDVLITGGLCGDDARFERTLASYNQQPKEGEIIVIGFYGETFEASFSIYGGWTPFGPERLITKSEGNVLYEIDGKPALDLYKRYLGDKAAELPGSALIYPLNVKSQENEQSFVRTILNIDEEQNAMILAGDVPEKATVQLMMTNMDNIAVASETAASRAMEGRKTPPELALLISCIGRKLVLDQRVEEEVDEVMSVIGNDTTIAGMYSYGEIAPFYGEHSCKLHNQTMTITLISE